MNNYTINSMCDEQGESGVHRDGQFDLYIEQEFIIDNITRIIIKLLASDTWLIAPMMADDDSNHDDIGPFQTLDECLVIAVLLCDSSTTTDNE